jgi:hypothetical protein
MVGVKEQNYILRICHFGISRVLFFFSNIHYTLSIFCLSIGSSFGSIRRCSIQTTIYKGEKWFALSPLPYVLKIAVKFAVLKQTEMPEANLVSWKLWLLKGGV